MKKRYFNSELPNSILAAPHHTKRCVKSSPTDNQCYEYEENLFHKELL